MPLVVMAAVIVCLYGAILFDVLCIHEIERFNIKEARSLKSICRALRPTAMINEFGCELYSDW